MRNIENEMWKRIHEFIDGRAKADSEGYAVIKRKLNEYYDDIKEEMEKDNVPFINTWIILHSFIRYINGLDGEKSAVINMDGAVKEASRLCDWEKRLVISASNNRELFRSVIDTWWHDAVGSDRITCKAKEYLRCVIMQIKNRYPYKK